MNVYPPVAVHLVPLRRSFRPIVASGVGFGAARFLSGLQAQCLRFAELLVPFSPRDRGSLSPHVSM